MNLWDKYIIKKFITYYICLSISTYLIYISSDYLFKINRFEGRLDVIIEFYSLRAIPFFLTSMPVLSFICLAIVIRQIRLKKEWHLARLVSHTHFTLVKPLWIITPFLCLIWVSNREFILPNIHLKLINSYSKISSKHHNQYHIISSEDQIKFLKPNNNQYLNISYSAIDQRNSEIKTIPHQNLVWKNNRWENSQTSPIKSNIPSPKELLHQRDQFLYANIMEIAHQSINQNEDSILFILFLERILFPLLFLISFCIASFCAIKTSKHTMLYYFCGLGLILFSSQIMLFRYLGLFFDLKLALFAMIFITLTSAYLSKRYYS